MDLFKNHGMEKCDIISAPMATAKLDADLQGTQVDETKYRSMIGGLMYLTASRSDIAFTTFVWKKHGRMMLDSIDNGLLVYPTIEENRQTRPKNYSELIDVQQLQDDCDVQATNIILHGLPPNGETRYEYYYRFSQLINDMHTIGMTMQQVQVNTKFLNALPSELSKFVTNVNLVKSLYTTNYDQLYAYLSQHKRHANEVCITRERYPDPLALVANSQTLYNPSQSPQHSGSSMYPPPQQFTPVYAAPIHHQYHHISVNPQPQSISLQSLISPSVTQQPQAEFPQLDSGLVVPQF
ncbi:hypothetical protein Tco_0746640 [Tanacetum coccineum]